MVKNLIPRQSEGIREIVSETNLIRQAKALGVGPVNLIFPEEIEENLNDFHKTLSQFDIEYKILFAHKPTKSRTLIHKAKTLGLGIDVASIEELNSALSVGFSAKEIECTGPKAERFLKAAVVHGSLISLDSIGELQRLIELCDQLKPSHQVRVLLRVTDLVLPGRTIVGRASRFGIRQEDLSQAYELLLPKAREIALCGFHLHSDKRASSDRASQLEGLIGLFVDAHRRGFTPTIINIGGGFRREQFESSSAWDEFVGELEESLVGGETSITWGAFSYGMRVNHSGKIVGRAKALSIGTWIDFSNVLTEILSTNMVGGGTIASFLRDNEICLMLEPGHALLDQCGVSLFDVIETKRGGGGHDYVVLDGHSSNVAAHYREVVADPLLIPKVRDTASQSSTFFIIGTVCREEDLFLRRKVSFSQPPTNGDILCFCNTAAYRADFEDSTPHQHPRGTTVIARKKEGQWQLLNEQQNQITL